MAQRYKVILFSILLCSLFLPLLELKVAILHPEPLKGAYTKDGRPEWNKARYFSGEYQDAFAKYFQSNIGLKEYFVRLYNQIGFSLFRQIRVSDAVVLAKDEQTLLEPNYINAYYGYTFSGEQKIKQDIIRLRRLDSLLRSKNKHLIILFSPGKASFYPELIPDNYRPSEFPTNYSTYAQAFKAAGLPFLDFKSWFIRMKDTCKQALYPAYGIHWTAYGAHLAADSLVRYMEVKSGKKMPMKHYTGFEKRDGLSGKEYDLGELLNLYYPLPAAEHKVPIAVFDSTQKAYRPNVLIIGDSYWWNIADTRTPDYQFHEHSFLFYFNTAHLNRCKNYQPVVETDIRKEIEQADYVILTCTETNDNRFPFGFPEKALGLYGDPYWEASADKEKTILLKMDDIRFNEQWMKDIRKKALANHLYPEEQIRQDAEWVIEHP